MMWRKPSKLVLSMLCIYCFKGIEHMNNYNTCHGSMFISNQTLFISDAVLYPAFYNNFAWAINSIQILSTLELTHCHYNGKNDIKKNQVRTYINMNSLENTTVKSLKWWLFRWQNCISLALFHFHKPVCIPVMVLLWLLICVYATAHNKFNQISEPFVSPAMTDIWIRSIELGLRKIAIPFNLLNYITRHVRKHIAQHNAEQYNDWPAAIRHHIKSLT